MKFFYSDTEPREPWRGGRPPDPHVAYLNHLRNWFELKRYYALGTLPDKLQATRELVICERKLDYWRRKPDFNQEKVIAKQRILAAMWEIEFVPNTFDETQQKWIRQWTRSKR
jgi:hypothetical protein